MRWSLAPRQKLSSAARLSLAKTHSFCAGKYQSLDFIEPSLFIKLAATAGVVLFATLIAERAGAFVGAMIAALPISAGPAYVFIAMDHDAAFVAESALASMGINVMIAPFLLVCVALVSRTGIVVALAAALAVWGLGAYLVLQAAISMTEALALNVVSISVCFYLSRRYLAAGVPASVRRSALDIVLRVLAVVSVVAAVIIGGRVLGAKVAGLVAVVPVVWFSMAVVIYGRLGGKTCAAVLANGIPAMFGFYLALAALYLTVEQRGSVLGLSLAAVICVSWTLALMLTRPYNPMYGPTARSRRA